MKLKKLACLSILVVFSLLGGAVVAEEAPDMSDQELCELEAEEAGMMSEDDILDYVEQCLEEFRHQNDVDDNQDDSNFGSRE